MRNIKLYFQDNIINNIFIVFTSVVIGYIAFMISQIMKNIFNEGVMGNNIIVFSKNLTFIIILFVGYFLVNIIYSVFINRAQWTGQKNITIYSMNKIFNTNYQYFLENNSNAIWTEVNMVSGKISVLYASIIKTVCNVIQFIMYGWIIFNIDFYAGIFSMLVIPIVYISTIGVTKKINEYRGLMLENMRELSSIAVESIGNINNIKVKNKYSMFLNKIDKKHTELNKVIIRSSFFENYWISVTGVINSLAPMIILYLIMKQTNIIKIKVSDIIVLYSFIPIFLEAFKKTYSNFMEYLTLKPFLKSLDKIINLKQENKGNIVINEFESLEVTDLKIIYKDRKIDIPIINIKNGENLIITGESGIGKSSLFSVLLGLNNNYMGSIKLNGIDFHDLDIKSVRKVIGIVFQNSNVFTMSLEDNISLGQNIILDEFIELVELKKQLESKKDDILNNNLVSGGEKSRIGIAQTLALNPKVLLIDEALSGVDEEMESRILNNIIHKFKDKTIIYISHRETSKKYFNKEVHFE